MDEMDIFLDDDALVDDLIEVETEDDDVDDSTPDFNTDTHEDNTDKKTKDTDTEDGLIEVSDEDDDDDIDLEDNKKTPSPDKLKDTSKSNDSSLNISSFVDALKEEEILHLEDGKEIKSVSDLYDAIQDEKERYLNEQLDSFPESGYREALEAVKSGVPIDQVLGRQANIEKYTSIDDDTISADDGNGEAIRRQVLTENFVSRGFSAEKAAKYVKRSFDSGDDIEDAKEALQDLQQNEKESLTRMKAQAKQQADQKEANRVAAIREFETNIKDVKEIIPGKKLTPARRKALYDGMTKGVDVVNGRSVDILNKFLIDGGNDARLFLSEVILTTDYGKKKELLSTRKAKKEATRAFEKQLNNSASSGFSHDSGMSNTDDYWDNAIL